MRILTISVERREDGFHVTAHPDCRWQPLAPERAEKLIAIASFTVKE